MRFTRWYFRFIFRGLYRIIKGLILLPIKAYKWNKIWGPILCLIGYSIGTFILSMVWTFIAYILIIIPVFIIGIGFIAEAGSIKYKDPYYW